MVIIGWINGGFFVLNKKIFEFISNPPCVWEREPLEKLAKKKQLSAYKIRWFLVSNGYYKR